MIVDALHSYLSPIIADVLARFPAPAFAVAVSGGADSMALLLLLHGMGHPVTALTVDHGLRPEAADEAKQVAAWCHARGIAHVILTPAPLPIPNVQTRAREMRYAAMTGWCRAHHVPLLFLAHHADDQSETVALQKHRGDSAPSRSGMALVNRRGPVQLVRPLLGVRKQVLIDYLREENQDWIDDPSNRSEAYARNRLRSTISDAERGALWREAQEQGAKRHQEDAARNAWLAMHAQDDDGIALDHPAWKSLDVATRSDVLSRAIRAVGGKPFRPRMHETSRLADAIFTESAGKATLGHCVVTWGPRQAIHIKREYVSAEPLDVTPDSPHMLPVNPLKHLASEPFWWFSYRSFSI